MTRGHGPDAVAALVEAAGWSYPVSVRRLERRYALENVELDEDGNSIMVAELLAEVDSDTFEDRADLEAKVAPVVERKRRERRTGIIERVRTTFFGGKS